MKPIVCSFSHKGKRPYQEDVAFTHNKGHIWSFGVFDGHGGSAISKALPAAYKELTNRLNSAMFRDPQKFKTFLRNAVVAIDEGLLKKLGKKAVEQGSTANIGFLDASTGIFYAINLGDSRGLFFELADDPTLQTTTMERTLDHKPESVAEQRRIKRAGGFVSTKNARSEVQRTGGILAMSRAHGDFELKEPYQSGMWVSNVPGIVGPRYLNQKGKQYMLVFGSDGIFDVLKNADIKRYIVSESKKKMTKADVCRMSKELVMNAIEEWNELPKGVGDNTTVTVAYIK